MDLDQRVKALEEELQILRSQIQATLLDIQEQLLTNAYPSLRADGTSGGGNQHTNPPDNFTHNTPAPQSTVPLARQTPSVDLPAVRIDGAMPYAAVAAPSRHGHSRQPDEASAFPSEQLQFAGVRSITFDENEPTRPFEPVRATPVKVARQEPAPEPTEAPTRAAKPKSNPNRQNAARQENTAAQQNNGRNTKGFDWAMMAELEGWVSEQVALIGAANTRELIKHYAEEGYYPRKVRDELIDLVETFEVVIAERNARPASHPEEAVERPAQKQAAPSKKSAPARSASNKTGERPASGKSRPRQTQTIKAAKQPTADKARATGEGEQPEGSSRLVLRLIAGVQNAGMGIQWRKRDG